MKAWLAVLVVALLAAGCNDNEIGIKKRSPNRPPETTLASGPPDSSGAIYKVHLYWFGSDPDGTIDHFDYIMIDHAAVRYTMSNAGDTLTAMDSLTTVFVEIPAPDDPRWRGSTATDSIFVTVADTLRRDPRPDASESTDDVRDWPFERWHTFFVRSVDNDGQVDVTPDYRSFNSFNIAPVVWLTKPVRAGSTFQAPSTVVFNWEGEDEVGDGSVIDPVASRWVIIPSKVDFTDNYLSFPESLYTLPSNCGCGAQTCQWSTWRAWDAADESGRRAVVKGLCKYGSAADAGNYLFAVQAMDEGGAVTQVFDWRTSRKNNVARVRVLGAVGPTVQLEDEFLGTFTFGEGARPVRLDVAAGQPIKLSWIADASRYGGEIVGYRWAWDLLNPEDDTEWDQNWARSARETPTRAFNAGTHRFSLQVRDNAETILSATLELTVHQVTRNRALFWVDDTQETLLGSGQEAREDAQWLGIFDRLAQANNFSFESGRDVYDVIENKQDVPPLQRVFDYEAIVWSVRGEGAALNKLARFFDPFVERNRNTVKSFNYLNIFMKNGGKLWVAGFRPAYFLWPIDRAVGFDKRAVNVTNWDDPIEPHPFIDSVGTSSLLFTMGIEMFDTGAGVGSAREQLRHFCGGLARARPQGWEQQTFTTTDVLAHTHTVDIPTADVDLAPAAGRTYQTKPGLDHQHALTLTQQDFVALQQGHVVLTQTADAGPPAVAAHTHDVTLIDKVGLWGAPALTTSVTWPALPPNPGRPNVEIYNMPGAMAAETPQLRPRPGLSLALYEYVSGVPQDPVFYPLTADRQPVFVLSKGAVRDPYYTRAFSGFEPEFLSPESHDRLAEYVLVRHFRLGSVAAH